MIREESKKKQIVIIPFHLIGMALSQRDKKPWKSLCVMLTILELANLDFKKTTSNHSLKGRQALGGEAPEEHAVLSQI